MARLGEVPLAHYYGTVDATPLYVMLAGISTRPGTSKRSPQSGQISRRLCNGSTRSSTRMETALSNMRGKTCRAQDSYDSIFHADGALAEGPIALCEVQGYVFGAKADAAKLAHRMGEYDFEIKLRGAARFNPISYPDGAVWPHDNAMIVLGLARYGVPWHAAEVFAAIPPRPPFWIM
jgi:glycogen debranching enzyme